MQRVAAMAVGYSLPSRFACESVRYVSVRVFRSYSVIGSLRVAAVTEKEFIAKSAGRCYKKRA